MLQYAASTAIWYVQSDDLPLSQLDTRYGLLSGATFTGAIAAPDFAPSGLAGATASSRYVGATTSGAPTTAPAGGFSKGDYVIDQTGAIWICTTAGNPGTWSQIGSGGATLDTTATDIQPVSNQSAGSTSKAADAGHTHGAPLWIPGDNGLLLANFEPAAATNSSAPTAGIMYLMKLSIHTSMTLSYLWWFILSAGSGASTGSYTGIYSSSGTLLSGSSDIASYLTSTNGQKIPLTTPQNLSAGTYLWAALLTNLATTQPSIGKSNAPTWQININLSSATLRVGTYGTGQTSLPSSITTSSISNGNSYGFWVGGS
jgi:hypothetical protein